MPPPVRAASRRFSVDALSLAFCQYSRAGFGPCASCYALGCCCIVFSAPKSFGLPSFIGVTRGAPTLWLPTGVTVQQGGLLWEGMCTNLKSNRSKRIAINPIKGEVREKFKFQGR